MGLSRFSGGGGGGGCVLKLKIGLGLDLSIVAWYEPSISWKVML